MLRNFWGARGLYPGALKSNGFAKVWEDNETVILKTPALGIRENRGANDAAGAPSSARYIVPNTPVPNWPRMR